MLSLLRHLARLLPTPEWILNHVVARLPYAAWRMRLYQAFGVRFADVRTGCVMLGAQLHYPRRIAIGRNSIVGPGCDLDARGGITIGDDVNISGGTRFMTAKHDVQDPDFVARFAPSSSRTACGSRSARPCSAACGSARAPSSRPTRP